MSEIKLLFDRRFLILGNLGLLAWIIIASTAVLFYNQLYGWSYLIFLVIMVYGVLRRLGCSSCYMCKECTSGFGRLAGIFFGIGYVKKESVGNRWGAVGFVYVLLLPVPAVFVLLSLVGEFSVVGLFVLGCLLALSGYSLATWFNRAVVKKM